MNPEEMKTKLEESLKRLEMQMQNERNVAQRAKSQMDQAVANIHAIEGAMQENRNLFDQMFPKPAKAPELSIVKPEEAPKE